MYPSLRAAAGAAILALLCPLAPVAVGEDEGLPLVGHTQTLAFTVDEASWVSVTVDPDGDSFVFDLLGDLYRLPLAGGDAERITSGMGFDSQPVLSPDGTRIAFVSDRDGADNLWLANADGSEPRKLSSETHARLISPVWTPDGTYVAVTHVSAEVELRLYHAEGGSGVTLTQMADAPEAPEGVGAAFSPDGRYVYFAEELGSPDAPVRGFPVTQIVRLDLTTGARLQITRGEGGGFRPLLSPDGALLVYGTRLQTETGLRVRDLATGADRWLTLPIQRDAQENFRPSSRGMLPGYAFTPDGSALLLSADGRFQRIALGDGARSEIPFSADVELDIGPDLTHPWRVPQGPITATLVQDPAISPDGDTIVASVLTRLYAKTGDAAPRTLTEAGVWAFKPVFSPDGRWLAYVTWAADGGGHIWRRRADGRGRAERLTEHPAFYTDLAWAPDGETLWAMRGNAWIRHQTYSEFGGLGTPLELVRLPADGGPVIMVMPAGDARVPHFGPEADRVYLAQDGALLSVNFDGGDRRTHLVVRGPRGNRFSDDAPGAEEVRISPDGRHALAHVNKQVWLMPLLRTGAGHPEVDVTAPALPAARLTDIGADYIAWTDGGDTVVWTIGRTIHRRSVASVIFRDEDEDDDDAAASVDAAASTALNDDAAEAEAEAEVFVPRDEDAAVVATRFEVTVPRPTPEGTLLLTGANLITMADGAAQVLRDADLLIDGNRIAALGARGSLEVPSDTQTLDLAGKWIVPGFIDTHAHWELRTQDVLEPHSWSPVVNLAYGVTSGLDVQTAFHDYFAYRDLLAAGMAVGQRAFMTGPGVFGVNDFQSYDEVHAYLRRYTDHYETPNIKSYLVGNRKQRQWVVLAAQDLGLLPTTEGGGDQRMDLTHAIDGMHGNEHNLPDTPIFADVVELFARTRTAYTPTLIVQYNAESAREWFFTRDGIRDDPKMQRFYPRNRLEELTRRRPGWQRDAEFVIDDGARAAAQIQRAGGLLGVGGHGELQGLGYHWEMWAYAMGGMTPAEILRAATFDAAHIIGAPEDLGSIEVGKLADMVVLDASPLADIRNTTAIDRVIQDGRVYDGDTLDQQWPEQRALAPFWWWDESDVRYVPPTP